MRISTFLTAAVATLTAALPATATAMTPDEYRALVDGFPEREELLLEASDAMDIYLPEDFDCARNPSSIRIDFHETPTVDGTIGAIRQAHLLLTYTKGDFYCYFSDHDARGHKRLSAAITVDGILLFSVAYGTSDHYRFDDYATTKAEIESKLSKATSSGKREFAELPGTELWNQATAAAGQKRTGLLEKAALAGHPAAAEALADRHGLYDLLGGMATRARERTAPLITDEERQSLAEHGRWFLLARDLGHARVVAYDVAFRRDVDGLTNADFLGATEAAPVVAADSKKKRTYTTWVSVVFEDHCNDGPANGENPGLDVKLDDVNIRLFESENGELTGGTWPDDKERHYVFERHSVLRSKTSVDINCAAGTDVCYGAAFDGGGSGAWGLGLDGSRGCDSCCFACPAGGIKTISYDLRC